jgi:hypothetical protein
LAHAIIGTMTIENSVIHFRAAEPPPSSPDSGQFVTSILDNLRRAGVQNTKRDERLELSRLDPYSGVYVQATGE